MTNEMAAVGPVVFNLWRQQGRQKDSSYTSNQKYFCSNLDRKFIGRYLGISNAHTKFRLLVQNKIHKKKTRPVIKPLPPAGGRLTPGRGPTKDSSRDKRATPVRISLPGRPGAVSGLLFLFFLVFSKTAAVKCILYFDFTDQIWTLPFSAFQ